MANKPNIVRPIGAKPSPEELEAQAKRAAFQKRNSLAEAILFNSLHNIGPECSTAIMRGLVDLAVDGADYMMEKLYGVSLKEKE